MKVLIKHILFIFLTVIPYNKIVSQNLVVNGNFEILSQCPSNQAQIAYATGWNSAGGTPDYYNSCATYTTFFSVPKNDVGYQQDCGGGNGYAGIFALGSVSTYSPNGLREYLQTTLIGGLQAAHIYLASMKVSLANHCGTAISTMGMYFSDTSVTSPDLVDCYPIILHPQVVSNTMLTDTVNWILITDTFVAKGGEQYLMIGNFDSTTLLNTSYTYTNNPSTSYYLIDNVSIVDITTTGIKQINASGDALIYQNAPNPFGDGTTIKYYVPENTSNAQIIFYDEFGGQLKTFAITETGAGQLNVYANDLSNGTYSYTLIVDGAVIDTKKMIKQ